MKATLDATRRTIIVILAGCAILLVAVLQTPTFELFESRPEDMLSVHSLIELFGIVISALVVTVSFHTLDEHVSQVRNILIAGLTATGLCDVAHLLYYEGMPGLVVDGTTSRAIFLWLMGRTTEVLIMALIAARVVLPGSRGTWLAIGAVLSLSIWWTAAFHLDVFPETFISGTGVTRFKSGFEYALSAANATLGIILWRQAKNGDSRMLLYAGSSLIMAMGGIALAHYQSPSEFINIGGHVFKVLSYALLYRAAFVAAIDLPYQLLSRSERDLRDSQDQIRTISDNLPGGMVYEFEFGAGGEPRFKYMSAGVERLFGLPLEDARRNPGRLYNAIHPKDRQRLQEAQEASFRSGVPFNAEVRVVRPDGETKFLQMRSVPRRLDDGHLVWDGVVLDVTDRERATADLHRLNLELEGRVAARTGELTHANRQLQQFSQILAHDLRAPLRHISSFAAILQQQLAGTDGESSRTLDRIIRSSDQMKRMIDGMLAVARLDRTKLALADVDLSALATAKLRELSEADPGRRVESHIEPGLHAMADRALLKSVFDNLLGNAWKFTARREVASISFGAREHHGERIYFVTDNGVGFPAGQADKLFSPFQRLHSADEFEGTGIGLASVRAIIENHGGRAWAEGEEGKGATVCFTLPGQLASKPGTQP